MGERECERAKKVSERASAGGLRGRVRRAVRTGKPARRCLHLTAIVTRRGRRRRLLQDVSQGCRHAPDQVVRRAHLRRPPRVSGAGGSRQSQRVGTRCLLGGWSSHELMFLESVSRPAGCASVVAVVASDRDDNDDDDHDDPDDHDDHDDHG